MFKHTDCTLVIGIRGSGKSYLGLRVQSVYPRRVIFDTLGEYDTPEYVSQNPDAIFARSFEEFAEAILLVEKRPSFTLIYSFDDESEASTEEFDQALRILYHLGNVLIVVEEVQTFSTPHRLPHWLKILIFKGRHRGIGMLFTTQRPGELHKSILSQCRHFFAGQLFETNDIQYLKGIFKEHTEFLARIPERRFLYFRPGQPVIVVNNDLKA